jgi:hypothetical protein
MSVRNLVIMKHHNKRVDNKHRHLWWQLRTNWQEKARKSPNYHFVVRQHIFEQPHFWYVMVHEPF